MSNVLSNGEMSVSLVRGPGKPYFWCSYTSATDLVSEAAKKGEPWFPRQLEPLCGYTDKYFLDIGANIGGISLHLASCGWKGVGIEASKKNCAVLRKSIALNEAEIALEEIGVWRTSGKLYFREFGPWGTICEASSPPPGASEIDVTTIDDLKERLQAHLPRLDLIKIDIEGSEMAALDGMAEVLEYYQYPPIFVEANSWALSFFGQNTSGDLIRKGQAYGYKAYRMNQGEWKELDEQYFVNKISTDFLFVHPAWKEHLLPLSNVKYPQKTREENIAFAAEKLRDYLAPHPKAIDNMWAAAICNTLRDFPEFITEELADLMKQAREKAENTSWLPVVRALSWWKA